MKNEKDKLNEFYRLFADDYKRVDALPMETECLLSGHELEKEKKGCIYEKWGKIRE